MNSVFDRLVNLFSLTGLNVQQGSYAEAEAFALASGCELVRQELASAKNKVFVFGDDGDGSLFADMLRLDYSFLTKNELCTYIVKRLSHSFGECENSDVLSDEFSLLGGAYITPEASAYTVGGITKKGIRFLGRLCEGGFPFNKPVRLEYSGMTFSNWDKTAMTFRGYDSLRLPFSCIETLSESLMH